MLNAYDTSRVKNYIFQDFPELRGKIAVRSFDSPFAEDAHPAAEKRLDLLLNSEARIRKDIVAQTSPEDQIRAELDRVFAVTCKESYAHKIETLTYCTYAYPGTVSLDAYGDAPGRTPEIYYLTQFSSTMNGKDIYEFTAGENKQGRMSPYFRTIAHATALLHEAGHVVQRHLGMQIDDEPNVKCETLSDVFAAAGAFALYGTRAAENLDALTAGRIAHAELDPHHASGPFLEAALHKKSIIRDRIGARQAIEYGERVFGSLGITG